MSYEFDCTLSLINLIVCDILIRIFVIEKMVKSAHTSDDEIIFHFFVFLKEITA